MKELKGAVSINRTHCSHEDDYINIEIEDRTSGISFVRAGLSLRDFAQAVTGLASIDATLEVRGLENVGKKLERGHMEFEVKGAKNGYGIENGALAAQSAKEACPDGWVPSTYFSSHGSFFTKGEVVWARCSITRYVDEEAATVETKG